MTGIIKVFEGEGKSASQDAVGLCEAIKDAVYKYDSKMPLNTAIGVLVVLKLEIIKDQS